MLGDCTQQHRQLFSAAHFLGFFFFFLMFCLFFFIVSFVYYGEVKEEKVSVPATKDFCEMQFSLTDSFKLNNFLVICLIIKF